MPQPLMQKKPKLVLWRPTTPSRINLPSKDVIFLIRGWNEKVGNEEITKIARKFGLGVKNEAKTTVLLREYAGHSKHHFSNNPRNDSTHGHH